MTKANQKANAAAVPTEAPAAFTVRVLAHFEEAGSKLAPNQLVILGADRAEALEASGFVSADPAGIEWCVGEYPDAPVLDLSGQPEEQSDGQEAEQDPAAE